MIQATGGAADEALAYSFTEGKNGTWKRGSSSGYDLTVKRSSDDDTTFSHFTGILVDGDQLEETDFTAEAGSLKATLDCAYLETLSVGSHTLEVDFDDGTAETQLKILAAGSDTESSSDTGSSTSSGTGTGSNRSNTGTSVTSRAGSSANQVKTSAPRTGDDASPGKWLMLMLLSGALLGCLALNRKRA